MMQITDAMMEETNDERLKILHKQYIDLYRKKIKEFMPDASELDIKFTIYNKLKVFKTIAARKTPAEKIVDAVIPCLDELKLTVEGQKITTDILWSLIYDEIHKNTERYLPLFNKSENYGDTTEIGNDDVIKQMVLSSLANIFRFVCSFFDMRISLKERSWFEIYIPKCQIVSNNVLTIFRTANVYKAAGDIKSKFFFIQPYIPGRTV